MNSGCNQLLSSTGLADQKHTGVRGRHLLDLLQHISKSGALANQATMTADCFHFLLEIYVFVVQLVAQALHFIESFLRCVFRTCASDGAADHFNKEPKTIHDGVRPFPLPEHRPEG